MSNGLSVGASSWDVVQLSPIWRVTAKTLCFDIILSSAELDTWSNPCQENQNINDMPVNNMLSEVEQFLSQTHWESLLLRAATSFSSGAVGEEDLEEREHG